MISIYVRSVGAAAASSAPDAAASAPDAANDAAATDAIRARDYSTDDASNTVANKHWHGGASLKVIQQLTHSINIVNYTNNTLSRSPLRNASTDALCLILARDMEI